MSKFYVVWRGRKPGVYSNWASAFEQVHEFSGARYKGYKDRDEAYAAYKTPAPAYNKGGIDKSLNNYPNVIAVDRRSGSGNKVPVIKEIPYQPSTIEMMRISLARFIEKIAQDKARRRRER